MRRERHQCLRGSGSERFGDGARVDVEAILVEPRLRRIGAEDVERNREAVRRQLTWMSLAHPVEHQPLRLEPRPAGEAQIDRLAGKSRHAPDVIFVIVAPIAGAEIAVGEEREIMIVRHVIEECRRAARARHRIGARRPEVGAQQEAAVGRAQQQHPARHSRCPPIARAQRVLELVDPPARRGSRGCGPSRASSGPRLAKASSSRTSTSAVAAHRRARQPERAAVARIDQARQGAAIREVTRCRMLCATARISWCGSHSAISASRGSAARASSASHSRIAAQRK